MLWFWGTGMCKFVKKPDFFIISDINSRSADHLLWTCVLVIVWMRN